MIFLFLLIAAYIVLPLVDVPFMGLSISAPIFFLIAMQVLFRPPEPWLKRFQGWILLAALFWVGIFISTTFNGLRSGGSRIDMDSWLTIIRYAYWLLVFIVTAYLVNRWNILERVSSVLGWAVFGLGIARLYEAIAWGKIGAWTDTRLLPQNDYGFIFSMFFPFLLAPIISARGGNKLFMILRMMATGAAVLINGSRGSWVAVAAGIFVFSVLYVWVKPQKIGWSILIVLLSALVLLGMQYAPSQVAAAFDKRYATFQNLEEEKSYMIRQLMIQKGLRLFKESPIIGVGASRFAKETIVLEIPKVLSYGTQSHFNVKSAHNSYLTVLAEMGIAGSVPLLVILIILGIRGFRASLKLVRGGRVVALCVFTSFIGMSIHMWSMATLTNTANWFVYGMLVAVIMIAEDHVQREAEWG